MELYNSIAYLLLIALWSVGFWLVMKFFGKDIVLEDLRKNSLQLMLYAEKYLSTKTGSEKLAWVSNQLEDFIPRKFKWLIKNENILHLVQLFYDEMKDLLDDGCFNDSV